MATPSLKKTIAKLDLLSLRLFLTICEEQSIGRAAERESIAPSAVTKRIQELEYLFDVKLLYRHPKGTVPTPVGLALAEHARNIFRFVEDIRVDLSEFAEGVKGHVRVTAIPSALVGFLGADLRVFLDTHPQVQMDVREELSSEVVHSVATGTADVGVYATPPTASDEVETYPYRKDELLAVLPRAHPLASRRQIAFAELLSTDLIGVQETSSVMNQLRRAAQDMGRQLQLRYQVRTNEVARGLVAAGLGTAVLPTGLAAPPDAAGAIVTVPLAEPWAQRELRLCVRKGAPLPAQVREFVDFLLSMNPQE